MPRGGAAKDGAAKDGAAKDGAEVKGIVKEVEDATAFPIMVSDGFTFMTGAPAVGSSAPKSDLGATAQSAIKNVLGWSWRPGADPKGLIGALNTSFKAVPRQGRVDYQYQQRNYAVAIQADMGLITGAQASLYTRAKATLDQMLLLLGGITPLLPDPDLNETEALRSLVRTEINDVVQQFGAEGGPNVQLVDKAFAFLGGSTWAVKGTGTGSRSQPYDQIGGHLGALRSAFGFAESWVNTIAEEQNLTNYIVLVDYVNQLFASWRANRSSFLVGGQGKTFMGTQLIQVSRALAVVAESLDELCYVMDTVFIQKAERQVLKITYPDGPPIFLGDLLEWIRNFVTSEGQQIINDSGKEGVQAFTATAERLKDLVNGAMVTKAKVPTGFRTRRVQAALTNLSEQLGHAIEEAQSIRRYQPPKIRWIDADREGDLARVTVYGTGLSDSAKIFIGYTRPNEKKVIAEVEELGVAGETFVSAPATATAIFNRADLPKLEEQLVKYAAEQKVEREEYALHLVIRNSDDQADSKVLSRAVIEVIRQ